MQAAAESCTPAHLRSEHHRNALGLGWAEVRELTLDEAIQRCWSNYVIKGA